MKLKVLMVTGLTALLLGTGAAQAASVYGQAADLTGSRSVGSGLEIIDVSGPFNESAWDFGIVEWSITLDGLSYVYEYTFKNFSRPVISHWSLDLTDDAVNDPNAVTEFKINGVLVNDPDLIFGDVEGIVGGVKFDEGDPEDFEAEVTYSFRSNRSPVWGHIQIEVGQEQANAHFLAQNTGFGDQSLEDTIHYVARPNGATVVPLPAAVWPGLVLLGGFALRRRRTA